MISNNNTIIFIIITETSMNNDNKHYHYYMPATQIHQKKEKWSQHYTNCWEVFCGINGEQVEAQLTFSIG